MLWLSRMDHSFKAREFLDRINKGLLDGQLYEELNKLSRQDLEEVARLLAEQIASKNRK